MIGATCFYTLPLVVCNPCARATSVSWLRHWLYVVVCVSEKGVLYKPTTVFAIMIYHKFIVHGISIFSASLTVFAIMIYHKFIANGVSIFSTSLGTHCKKK